MNRREFIKVSGALAVAVAGADTLKTLMANGPPGMTAGDAFAGTFL